MDSNHKVIKVKSDTYSFLAQMKELLQASSFDEVLRRSGHVIFEHCKEEFSRNAWLRICEEENNLAGFSATE